MRALSLFLVSCIIACAAETPGVINKIRTSSFDGGRLARRFTADSSTASTSPEVKNGRVEFFGPDSEETPTGVLSFDDAVYKSPDESVSGDGAVTFTSSQGTASGTAFDSRIPDGILKIHFQVRFESEKFILTGSRGDIAFTPKGATKDKLIKAITVTGSYGPGGNVAIVRKPDQKASFDRIETATASYDAIAKKLLVKVPFTTWRDGDKIVTELTGQEYAEIDLTK